MKQLLMLFAVCSAFFCGPRGLCAASFDCAKAASAAEKTVCADRELSELDGKLGAAFKQALGGAADKEKLKVAQRAWLKQRDACPDAACLTRLYQSRLGELTADVVAKPAASGVGLAQDALKRRETWRVRLQWPNECEEEFKEFSKDWDQGEDTGLFAGGADAGLGARVYPLAGRSRLALVQCGMAAYQAPFVALLFEEDAPGPGRLLSFKQYDREASGKVKVTDAPDLAGEATFIEKDKTLTVFALARGIGDCGSFVTYAFDTGQPKVVQARAQACNDRQKPVIDPKKWPLVEKP